MPYVDESEGIHRRLECFGLALREARHRVGLTQMALEERTGVDQTLISRLERGKIAHFPLHRVLALGEALGRDLPLGTCPHDHHCVYRPQGTLPPPSKRVAMRYLFRS